MHFNFSFLTEFVINPNGKSEVCILHEYMQRVLKVRPVYNFFECGKFFCMCLEIFQVTMSRVPHQKYIVLKENQKSCMVSLVYIETRKSFLFILQPSTHLHYPHL